MTILPTIIRILAPLALLGTVCDVGAHPLPGATPNIVIINSYHSGHSWTAQQENGFVEALSKAYPHAQFFTEYMDRKRLSVSIFEPELAEHMAASLAGTKVDLIYATDDLALEFAQDWKARFADATTPIVATGINDASLADRKQHPDTVAFFQKQGGLETIRFALDTMPDARLVVIVMDGTQVAKDIGDQLDEQVRSISGIPVIKTPPGTWADTREFIARFDSHTIFMLAVYAVDSEGRYVSPDEASCGIATNARGPVYIFNDQYAGTPDPVGGYINLAHRHGAEAARVAVDLISGKPVSAIPDDLVGPLDWVFSAATLKRFNISENALPPHSIVRWKETTFFSEHPVIFIGTAVGIGAQTLLIVVLLGNVARRRRIEAELIRNETRTRDLIDYSPLAMLVVDKYGQAKIANKRFTALLGYDLRDLQSFDTSLRSIIKDQHLADSLAAQLRGDEGDGEQILAADPVQTTMVAKDLRIVEGELYFARAGGMLFLIINDVTEQNKTLQSLRKARRSAQAASEAKSRFLANVSHEIRTPMNGIMGMVQLLRETDTAQDQREYINTIQDSSDLLLAVINDILDLSKIESGMMKLDCAPIDLKGFLRSVEAMAAPSITSQKLGFFCEFSPSLPEAISFDAARLKQVLLNLLSNAAKFTNKGQIRLRVTGEGVSGGKGTLCFSISDTGIGIAPELIERIFDPFVQADNSSTRQYQGAGLGLTICRRLVELMGSKIDVRSRLGEGSTFSFTIHPDVVPPCECARQDASQFEKSLGELQPLKILLAEDNAVNRKVVCMMLARMGYEVCFAINGKEALDKATAEDFDVILMDVQMPVMDGLESCSRIRKALEGKRQPHIVALTAHAMNEDVRRCIESGMDAHLAKPLKAALLREALNKAFSCLKTKG